MTGIRKYVWKSRESFDPFYFKFVLFVVVLCCIDGAHGLSNGGFAVYKNGTMGKETLGIVSSAEEDIYAFNLTKRLNSSQVSRRTK